MFNYLTIDIAFDSTRCNVQVIHSDYNKGVTKPQLDVMKS